MDNFDDLRRSTQNDIPFEDDDDDMPDGDTVTRRLFLGMTPIERMFISMFLFMNVAVLGIALLLATGRIGG